MKRITALVPQPQSYAGLLIAAMLFCLVLAGCATGSREHVAAGESPRPLTGAELYAINCNRCHPERYPTEWNSAQWATILTHMRVRANLSATQARLIQKYLQENSGN